MIRDATTADAAAIAALYNPYVRETVITFEYEEVSSEDMASRIARVQELDLPWLVLEDEGSIIGFAYAAQYRPRAAYRHSVETTIYLAHGAGGRGLGRKLYDALIARLRTGHPHSAISLIALPNDASIALHLATGWSEVGQLREVGRKFDRWIDVAYYQLDVSST
ncbi:GNAT family N-acetyltransferase [Demequina muriae]|uniref:N-acetyltransferase family protein n=1 Tax=Demequina muriae TaxID=3051664 RepID=A0ABT8GGN5_9MICO|nr:GNAT family N-acetyltransferase [Demequina sp. EGI L300058]MDN4480598.1 N-acetyltransferase family protein [Demequina sp. EGI L300058]